MVAGSRSQGTISTVRSTSVRVRGISNEEVSHAFRCGGFRIPRYPATLRTARLGGRRRPTLRSIRNGDLASGFMTGATRGNGWGGPPKRLAPEVATSVEPGATVLVTGGTGSFGSSMVRRLLKGGIGEIRVLSRDELKQHEMRTALGDPRLRFYLGDVRSRDSVDRAMRGVDYVFHAAALKQVPSCEFFPLEAVMTNILGSSNVIESASAHKVRSVVCLGTDKAAYPVNAMGMTKALMEKVAQAYARNNASTDTIVSTIRYGNVMCSRGSVIPLFVDQIRSGRPLTLTDPSMTRFLMSLDEAVLLVEHAFTHARQGDLFIRKAPASTVKDLALAVAASLNMQPEIRVIGTRHGEKLYETLATREELTRAEDQGDYYRVSVDARNLNYDQYFVEGEHITADDDYHSHNTQRLDAGEVLTVLERLPAFQQLLPNQDLVMHRTRGGSPAVERSAVPL